jgi:type I restriction enzyme S subunit
VKAAAKVAHDVSLSRQRDSLTVQAAPATYAKWKRVRIGDALKLINGRAFKPSEWSQQGRPIVRIQNLNDPDAPFNFYDGELPAKFGLKKGDLLFAWSGTPGTSFGAHIWRGDDAWLNQHIFKVIFDETQFDKRFLCYAINQNLNQYIAAAHGGAGLAHITKGRFEASTIICPLLDEQKRIVAEIEKQFSRLDEAVTGLRRVKVNLKRYKASILRAAVKGRLVLTEAELARREGRGYETGAQLLQRILDERRRRWKEKGRYTEPGSAAIADLPELPEGWSWSTVGQLGSVRGGKRLPAGHTYSEQRTAYPYLRVTDFEQFGVRDSALEYLSEATRQEIKRYTISAEDVYISIAGTIGMVGQVPAHLGGANLTENAAKITGLFGIEAKHLVYWLASPKGREHISGSTIATTQAKLALFRIERIPVPLPPSAEQRRIIAEVERRLSVIQRLDAEVVENLVRVRVLRGSVLSSAFSVNTGEAK